MLNLLFISDSSKIKYIKSVLQPVLKVIIDIVPDFDRGLKEVFEKRPATVCIQDQIAGVTGESVARHIQMLLGTGSPKFILIHDGSSKVKQIKGLFEYIIDLNQPEDKLGEEIQNTLKVLIGDQWDKIFIPPKQTPVSISSSASLSKESNEDSGKLVDDFLSELESESTDFPIIDVAVPVPHPGPAVEQTTPFIAQDTADILAEMQLEVADEARQVKIAADKSLLSDTDEQDSKKKEVLKPPAPVKPSSENTSLPPIVPPPQKKPVGTSVAVPKPKQDPTPATEKTVELPTKPAGVVTAADQAVPVKVSQAPPVAPAEFRIKREKTPAGEHIPDNLLTTFEENYRSKSNSRKIILITIFVLLLFIAVGGWYFLRRNPGSQPSVKHRALPIDMPNPPAPAIKPPLPATQPLQTVQKPAPATVEKPSVPPVFPTFIPRDGYDKSFAAKNPGWERYIGNKIDYRVFSAGGKPKAVQVIAIKGNVVPESLVKSVLTELAGNADYKISSRENKSGFLVLRGTVAQKADVLFYKKNSTVRAFVISLY